MQPRALIPRVVFLFSLAAFSTLVKPHPLGTVRMYVLPCTAYLVQYSVYRQLAYMDPHALATDPMPQVDPGSDIRGSTILHPVYCIDTERMNKHPSSPTKHERSTRRFEPQGSGQSALWELTRIDPETH